MGVCLHTGILKISKYPSLAFLKNQAGCGGICLEAEAGRSWSVKHIPHLFKKKSICSRDVHILTSHLNSLYSIKRKWLG